MYHSGSPRGGGEGGAGDLDFLHDLLLLVAAVQDLRPELQELVLDVLYIYIYIHI